MTAMFFPCTAECVQKLFSLLHFLVMLHHCKKEREENIIEQEGKALFTLKKKRKRKNKKVKFC